MRLLLLLALSMGCTDPFAEAQKADTVEAYEAYIAQNPTGNFRLQAETRLEELMLEAARAEKTLAAYDAYMERFPEGALREKAAEEREEFLWSWADEQDTVEGYQKYLDEYPRGDKKRKQEARRRMKMAEHRAEIELSPVTVEQINLANDPEGPLNGWGFFVDVTNVGERPIQKLRLQASMLDGDGKVLDAKPWRLVDTVLRGRNWDPDEYKAPIQPGETRQWKYTTGDLPAGWSRRVVVKAVSIGFADE